VGGAARQVVEGEGEPAVLSGEVVVDDAGKAVVFGGAQRRWLRGFGGGRARPWGGGRCRDGRLRGRSAGMPRGEQREHGDGGWAGQVVEEGPARWGRVGGCR